jgi:hypothetical protein
LAGTFLNGPDKERLLQYADEMEQRAVELEREAGPVIQQPQQQAQQQQATEPAPDPPAPKTKT